jgi:DNA-binding transcriptional MocR family regulator
MPVQVDERKGWIDHRVVLHRKWSRSLTTRYGISQFSFRLEAKLTASGVNVVPFFAAERREDLDTKLPPALVLGFAAWSPAQIREGLGRLARALEKQSVS